MLADILTARGWGMQAIPLYAGVPLPALSTFELLVMMGGPMSVNDETTFPWLAPEKALAREAIAAGKAVLGICLGAQMIAAAQGAKVYANPEKEIGWWPIHPVAPGGFAFPPDLTVFHWHGETFDLPEGAVHLARSEACAHQAFQIGRRVIGLQFHLETTPTSARMLIEHARDEMVPAPFVQSEETLLYAPEAYYDGCRKTLEDLVDYLITPPTEWNQ